MIDDQGLVYANPAKTELIGVVPNFAGSDFSGGFANIVIPASVKAITGYVNVTHPNGASQTTNTNHGAFEGMASLTNVTFASNNVTRIGNQAFKGCSNLATISLPSSVSYIGNNAFENCSKLNNINLQNVSYIGNSAFKNAFSSIPTSSVEVNVDKANYVGANAFESTSGLKTINFANNTVLQTVANNAFMSSGITSLDLSQATKLLTIGNNAFQGCSSLTEVKVPKSLTSFGNNVFGNVSSSNSTATTSLTTIDLSATQVTSLPDNLFQGCTSLSNVKLPSGLTSIGQSAFQGTTSLTSVNLPTGLTTINQGAFANTASLTALTVPKTLSTLGSADNSGSDVNATFTGSGLTALDLSKTALTSIANSTFNGATKLETVKLPSTVTRINDNAFKGTTALKTLTQEKPAASETPAPAPGSRATGNQLASTLTYIGTSAFQGTGLESIDLSETKIIGYGDNVSLGNSAFQDAVSLSSVILPAGLKGIPAASFAGTTSLKTIEIPSTVNRINAGNSEYKGAFQGSGLTSIDLSGTGITGNPIANQPGAWPSSNDNDRGTFSNMPDLTTVILPAGLTGIPKDAFANSAKLATVKFGTADASNGGSGNQRATTPTGEDNAITLPKGITTIDANAFAGTKASTVDLSQVTGLTSISNSVFQNMASLTEVKLPASITTINQSAFQNDAALKKLTQASPSQARGEDDAAPAEGTATFGKSLTSIGQNAFYGTGFSTVDLSKAVGTQATSGGSTTPLSVGSNAFTNMADLTTVKLPKDSNINPAYFGNPTAAGTEQKLKTIMYGTEETVPAAFSGTGNTFSGTNYNKISNETIDLTGYANLTTLGTGVLFGNTAMKTLKMNAPIMSLSGSAVNVADPVWQLGTVPTAGATDNSVAYATAAIGGNSALTNIEFGNFKKKNGSNQFDNITQFSEITSDTWTQVSKLMNMFAKYTDSQSVTNLTPWAVSQTSGSEGGSTSNGVIQADIGDNTLNQPGDTDSKKWDSVTGGTSEAQKIVTDGTTSATLTHNGVTWTYTKNTSSSDNSITITGTGINIYKAKNGSNGYQTYFGTTKTAGSETATPKEVTVKITLVPASTSSTGRFSK